jgi:hypothetical protein
LHRQNQGTNWFIRIALKVGIIVSSDHGKMSQHEGTEDEILLQESLER